MSSALALHAATTAGPALSSRRRATASMMLPLPRASTAMPSSASISSLVGSSTVAASAFDRGSSSSGASTSTAFRGGSTAGGRGGRGGQGGEEMSSSFSSFSRGGGGRGGRGGRGRGGGGAGRGVATSAPSTSFAPAPAQTGEEASSYSSFSRGGRGGGGRGGGGRGRGGFCGGRGVGTSAPPTSFALAPAQTGEETSSSGFSSFYRGGGRGGGGRGGGGRGRGGFGGGRGAATSSAPPSTASFAPPQTDKTSSSNKSSKPNPAPSAFDNDGRVWLAKAIADSGLASRRAALDLVSTGRVTVNGERVSSPATRVVPFPSMLLQASQKDSSSGPTSNPSNSNSNNYGKKAPPGPKPDLVAVDGKALPRPAKPVYFAINKPKGYHCTSEAGAAVVVGGRRRKLVTDLLAGWLAEWRRRADKRAAAAVAMKGKRGGGGGPYGKAKGASAAVVEAPPRLFTVGRLDAATTGLILVTNDGTWAQSVAHPSSGLTREYVATLSRKPTRKELEAIADGCEVDGVLVKPLAVYAPPAESGGDPLARNRVRVVVAEGRNHEVRKLVAAAGADVVALKRVRVGGYRLPGDLGIGGVKELKPYEAARVADKGLQSNTSVDIYAV